MELAAGPETVRRVQGWHLVGRAQIDARPPAAAALTIRSDGSWTAEVQVATLAGQVDLFFVADGGGHFCGPAFVERSAASTEHGLQVATWLTGNGPLLIVDPSTTLPELPPRPDMLDAEVID